MQYILNARERNRAFFQFFIFFLVTVALIIGAIYFNLKLPVVQNRFLQEEIDERVDEDIRQRAFIVVMCEVRSLLDSLDKNGPGMQLVEIQLSAKMKEMYSLKGADSSYYGTMNRTITESFAQLQQFITSAATLQEKAEKADELDRKLKACEANLDVIRYPNDQ